MNLPFTLDQFKNVFQQYNENYWPIQFLLYLFALIVIVLVFSKWRHSNTAISFILAFFWFWMGLIYHITYFAFINKAAYTFGIAFIIQSVLFFVFGVFKNKLQFSFRNNLKGITGLCFIGFALSAYPVIGYILGHIYPKTPTFGLPCPTTIFTLGVLLLSDRRPPALVLIIPLLWSIIGFTASFTLGFKEDISLIIAGIVTSYLLFRKDRKVRTELVI